MDKEIKNWLKANNYTEYDLDRFWSDCVEVNWKCQALQKSGKTWRDLNLYVIKQLPTLKEKTLQQNKEAEERNRKQREKAEKEKKEKEYYYKNFDKIMVKKIDTNQDLTKEELSKLISYSIHDEYGENSRWTRSVYSVCCLCGRYFALYWEEGLTEYQENCFYEQPYEVFPYKTIKIVESMEYFNKKPVSSPDENYYVFDQNKDTESIFIQIRDIFK